MMPLGAAKFFAAVSAIDADVHIYPFTQNIPEVSSFRDKITKFGVSYNGSMNGWGSFGWSPTLHTPTYNMSEKGNTTGLGETVHLKELLLVEGKHVPTQRELIGKMEAIDLKKAFKGASINPRHNGVNFSFDSIDKARLFLMAIECAGNEAELFSYVPEIRVFDEKLIPDHRIDGGQFSYSEKEADRGVEAAIFVRNVEYENRDRVRKYESLIRKLVVNTMPHLKDKVGDFSFLWE